MTAEEKQLLLIDLCSRLPYGVKVKNKHGQIRTLSIGNADLARLFYDDFSVYSEKNLSLPLLRPMYSMTEEEKKEWHDVIWKSQECSIENSETSTTYVNDWLLKHHFDVHGLIKRGLALEADKEIYEDQQI